MKLALVAIDAQIGVAELEIWVKKHPRAVVVVELLEPAQSSRGDILKCARRVMDAAEDIHRRRHGRPQDEPQRALPPPDPEPVDSDEVPF